MIVSIFFGLLVLYGALHKTVVWTSQSTDKAQAVTSPEFTAFSRQYLVIYLAAMLADWLQGPYVYRLYETYGYTVDQIAILFVAGFGSSMVMGTVVGSLADTCGRRNSCLLFCVLYFFSCLTKHSPSFAVLMVGRVLGGIATSILYAAFEAWLVTESHTRHFHETQLGSIFASATTGNGIVAIASGVIASAANDMWGVVAPFDVSAFVLAATAIAILFLWNENYGDKSAATSLLGNFKFGEAYKRMIADKKILALGVSQSLYESAMYIFVFLWTPTLEHLTREARTIKHGWIFACFMVCCMVGSEVFSLLISTYSLNVEEFSYHIFAFASVAFMIPVISTQYYTCLVSFLVFEICCGLYWPVMGTLRGKYIPDDVRCTTMTMFRIPLNLIVVAVLTNLKNMDHAVVWMMCAAMLLVSAFVQFYTLNYNAPSSSGKTYAPLESMGNCGSEEDLEMLGGKSN
ncbi:major facilitator superfamily [Obelidium mucronatum]|nr:major facilitator superfamily [Obelidium mucronatum]